MTYTEEFKNRFQLSTEADLCSVKVAVEAVYEANEIGYNFLSELDNTNNKDGFLVYSQLNLLARVFEQVQGMLVCIVTGCPTRSETMVSNLHILYCKECRFDTVALPLPFDVALWLHDGRQSTGDNCECQYRRDNNQTGFKRGNDCEI